MFGVALETSRRNSRVGSCLAIITTCNYLTQLIYLKQDKPEELRDDERPKSGEGKGNYTSAAQSTFAVLKRFLGRKHKDKTCDQRSRPDAQTPRRHRKYLSAAKSQLAAWLPATFVIWVNR